MSNLMNYYQNKYNTKYNTKLIFFGSIDVNKMKTKNNYYLYINLTVIDNNSNKYTKCKEFFINDVNSYKDKTIKMDDYEFIDIINDLEYLYNECSSR